MPLFHINTPRADPHGCPAGLGGCSIAKDPRPSGSGNVDGPDAPGGISLLGSPPGLAPAADTAGKRTARTTLARYGPEGRSANASKAHASRRKRAERDLTEMERELLRTCPAKRREAAKPGLECAADLEEVALAMLAEQGGRCELSGRAFRPRQGAASLHAQH